jgi:hypothetical protein
MSMLATWSGKPAYPKIEPAFVHRLGIEIPADWPSVSTPEGFELRSILAHAIEGEVVSFDGPEEATREYYNGVCWSTAPNFGRIVHRRADGRLMHSPIMLEDGHPGRNAAQMARLPQINALAAKYREAESK